MEYRFSKSVIDNTVQLKQLCAERVMAHNPFFDLRRDNYGKSGKFKSPV